MLSVAIGLAVAGLHSAALVQARPSLDASDAQAVQSAAKAALTKLASLSTPATEDGSLLSPWWATAPAYDTFLEYSKWTGAVDADLNAKAVEGLALMSHGASQDFLAGENPWSERWNDDICWGAIAIQNGVDCYGVDATKPGTDGGQWGVVGPRTASQVWAYKTDACGGGLRWSRNPSSEFTANAYKSVITNLDFIILSCRVYLSVKDKTALDQAIEIWAWLTDGSGLITDDGKVYDGLGEQDCDSISSWQWSYNAGQAIQAAVWLAEASGDDSYLDKASAILSHAAKQFGEVVMENCPNGSCSKDAVNFKGIFVRALPYLYRATQKADDRKLIQTILKSSVEAMAKNTCDDDWLCGAQWDSADNEGAADVQVVDQIVSSALLVAATGVLNADRANDSSIQPVVASGA